MTTIIYRQVHCRMCGVELEHKPSGRGREFCGAACRVAWNRAHKRWVRASVDAALAGDPEPSGGWGYPVEIASYDVHENGSVTKWAGSRRVTK